MVVYRYVARRGKCESVSKHIALLSLQLLCTVGHLLFSIIVLHNCFIIFFFLLFFLQFVKIHKIHINQNSISMQYLS